MTSIDGDRPTGPPFSEFDVSAGFGMYVTGRIARTQDFLAELGSSLDV